MKVGFGEQVDAVEGMEVDVEGEPHRLKCIARADSKAHVILAGCMKFTCTEPDASVCFTCGKNRADCLAGFGKGTATFAEAVRPSGVMQRIRPSARVPDFHLHGVKCNTVNGLNELVVLLVEEKHLSRAAAIRLVQGAANVAREATRSASRATLHGDGKGGKGKDACRIECSAATWLMRDGRWKPLLAKVKAAGVSDTIMGHVTKWWTGFAASCQFVWQTAFMSGASVQRLKAALAEMGQAHLALKWPIHLWTHLWVDHMGGFAALYRILSVFSCADIEGHHRLLKVMLRNSTGVAVRKGKMGLEGVVQDHILDDCLFEEGYDVGMRGVRAQLAHARNKCRRGNGVGAERRTAAGLAARRYARSWAQRRLQAREKRGQG
jgi:hypothetical protein